MKNLLTIFAALTITFTSAFATSTPVTLINTDAVVVVSIESLDIFNSAQFNAETENLSFTTTDEISMIQIFNADGQLEFQLPVMSNDVKINKNLFGEGSYQLGFILEGESQLHVTQVTIK
jgi:hypothetical protein